MDLVCRPRQLLIGQSCQVTIASCQGIFRYDAGPNLIRDKNNGDTGRQLPDCGNEASHGLLHPLVFLRLGTLSRFTQEIAEVDGHTVKQDGIVGAAASAGLSPPQTAPHTSARSLGAPPVQLDAITHLLVKDLRRRNIGNACPGLGYQIFCKRGFAAPGAARHQDHLSHCRHASTKCSAASGQPAKCR